MISYVLSSGQGQFDEGKAEVTFYEFLRVISEAERESQNLRTRKMLVEWRH